jgi:hypothetical protein
MAHGPLERVVSQQCYLNHVHTHVIASRSQLSSNSDAIKNPVASPASKTTRLSAPISRYTKSAKAAQNTPAETVSHLGMFHTAA